MNAEKMSADADLIGESPIWDGASGRLFWIDGFSGRVKALLPETRQSQEWEIGERIGSIALAGADRLLLALQHGFYEFDLATSKTELLCAVPHANPVIRLNDGKIDHAGRFVCGEWATNYKAIGAINRYTYPDRLETLAQGIRVGNGICFSPDGDVMYFADSITKKIQAYPYDVRSGALGEPRLLFDTSPLNSSPDGATVDREGYVWSALVHAGKIARIAPGGKLDGLVDVPVDFPSCPAFGGRDLDVLFVTSIKDSGTGHTVSKHPDGGCVFALRGLGVRGLPEPVLKRG